MGQVSRGGNGDLIAQGFYLALCERFAINELCDPSIQGDGLHKQATFLGGNTSRIGRVEGPTSITPVVPPLIGVESRSNLADGLFGSSSQHLARPR
jgi:hypothetical protein